MEGMRETLASVVLPLDKARDDREAAQVLERWLGNKCLSADTGSD
jgi:hypothetical protein